MRGLLAPLSPNEENTLRRIARGDVLDPRSTEGHVVRLMMLMLVEEKNGTIRLTDVGIRRHADLDRPKK